MKITFFLAMFLVLAASCGKKKTALPKAFESTTEASKNAEANSSNTIESRTAQTNPTGSSTGSSSTSGSSTGGSTTSSTSPSPGPSGSPSPSPSGSPSLGESLPEGQLSFKVTGPTGSFLGFIQVRPENRLQICFLTSNYCFIESYSISGNPKVLTLTDSPSNCFYIGIQQHAAVGNGTVQFCGGTLTTTGTPGQAGYNARIVSSNGTADLFRHVPFSPDGTPDIPQAKPIFGSDVLWHCMVTVDRYGYIGPVSSAKLLDTWHSSVMAKNPTEAYDRGGALCETAANAAGGPWINSYMECQPDKDGAAISRTWSGGNVAFKFPFAPLGKCEHVRSGI